MGIHLGLKEKELLGKIQENLASARQLAQQLIAQYKPPLGDFIRHHLSQANVEEITKKTFINVFNEIVSGKVPNDFFQRLQAIVKESAHKKNNPRLMVLPPLNFICSNPATNICDKEIILQLTRCVRDIKTSVDELFEMYRRDLLKRVRPYVNYNLHDADDVVQNTHIRAYRKIYTLFYDKDGNLKTSVDHHFLSWLHTIALRIIVDDLGPPVADYPEDEDGEGFEPRSLKTQVDRQAILRILLPELLHVVASQNEPHKVFVFWFKEVIGWGPTDIVKRFSDFTLEELAAQLRKQCMRLFEWSSETVAWVLGPLSDKLSEQDKHGKAYGKRRLGDYWSNDPANDIQMHCRSVAHKLHKGLQNRPDIMALVGLLKGL